MHQCCVSFLSEKHYTYRLIDQKDKFSSIQILTFIFKDSVKGLHARTRTSRSHTHTRVINDPYVKSLCGYAQKKKLTGGV